jgi:radical SAM protein with 4Fe4S-binding SPASM domain
MAGVALRQSSMATLLNMIVDVTVASPYESGIELTNVKFIEYDVSNENNLEEIVRKFDIILFQGHILQQFPFLKKTDKILIVDIFSPIILESLNWHQYESFDNRLFYNNLDLSILLEQLTIGDFFICSSEVQRRFWIGLLTALNRISPYTADQDQELNKLLQIVPFGFFEVKNKASRTVLKGVHPKIGSNDKVLTWNGGIYNWLDPLTPIKAMVDICQKRSDIKMIFLGTRHPNPNIPIMPICHDAIRLSQRFGLMDRFVFFLDWVPASERYDYILESDATISFYHDNIETRYSYRTRFLDNIATGIPPIVTDCRDTFSKMIKDRELGKVVSPSNVDEASRAIFEIVDNDDLKSRFKENIQSISKDFLWAVALSPLVEFVKNPAKASDFGKGSVEYSRVYSLEHYSPTDKRVYPSIVQYLDENDFTHELKDLYVETTSYCNLRCEMCLITAQKSKFLLRDRFGHMSLEIFKNLEDVLPTIDFLSLNGTGEALLHPEFFDFVDFAKKNMKSGSKISFNTNGVLLTKENVEKIIDSCVDILMISIDAPTKELYESIRKHADFEILMDNLIALSNEKKRRGVDHPTIGIETVVMKRNLESLVGIVDIAKKIDANILAMTNMVAYKKELCDELIYDKENAFKAGEIYNKIKELSLKAGIENIRIPALTLEVQRKCWFTDKSLIKWDGSVMPCCQLVDSYTFFLKNKIFFEKELSFGNIKDSSFSDIWNSKEYAEFRHMVSLNKFPPACKDCLWNGVI